MIERLFRFFILTSACQLCFSCSDTTRSEQPVQLRKESYLTVCQLGSNIEEFNDRLVEVKGNLEGFHNFALSPEVGSPDCGAIYIQFDGLQLQQLLKDRLNRKVGLIKGDLIVEGKFKKDGRKILRSIDVWDPVTRQIETKMGYSTVNSLEEPRIISFRQTFDE